MFVASLGYGVWRYVTDFGGSAAPGAPLTAAFADVALFSVFALHHSLVARTGLKNWIAHQVSPALERSVYVWIASALFILVCALWQPLAGVAWTASRPWSFILTGAQVTGLVVTGVASRQLDVFSLAGVRQAMHQTRRESGLVTTGWYRVVRHPIYFGWVLMVWPAPQMTMTRLVFAVVSTTYLAVAIPFEERALVRQFGETYRQYAHRVRARMVPFLY